MAIALVCTSCVSVFKTNVEALKTTQTVAVVSMYGEEYVDFTETFGGSLLATAVNAVQGDDYDLSGKIPALKKNILNSGRNYPFDFVPEKKVIGTTAYKTIDDSNFRTLDSKVTPKGYKKLAFNEKEKIKAAISKAGADSGMIITWQYKLARNNGLFGISGGTKVWGSLTFFLCDRDGNQIFNKTISETSDTGVIQGMGVTFSRNMPKMVDEATEKILKKFDSWLKKEMA